MRQALSKLGTRPPKQNAAPQRSRPQTASGGARHRFRQDGEVLVVQLALPQVKRGKEEAASVLGPKANLRHEQPGEGRGPAVGERARGLDEVTDQLRAMQTRLGHAELALTEAAGAARASQDNAAALRQALQGSRAQLEQVRAELSASERSREALEHQLELARYRGPEIREASAVPSAPAHRKVGRPLGSTKLARIQDHAREPAPVKWWAGD